MQMFTESIQAVQQTPPTESGILFGWAICGATPWLSWVDSLRSMGVAGGLDHFKTPLLGSAGTTCLRP